ncbi:related to urease accessory protein UreD [Cephalotrichum gorgonifer]|uniref:Related to urease accessory protein UreD n=1 Tax=Cephalotrichum gorgonifer TaxID=2041049 RepID=A0AAE8MRP9_9PEZI|nr:related to urease accessory protein UreD [Cephalotrichum gorgonifer]
MNSPFPQSSSRPGKGRVVAELLPNGGTGLSTSTYQYPLKLISPKSAPHHRSAILWLLSYGGGLVAGDQVNLTIDVLAGARLCIVTQGHTKVFKSPSRDIVTRQNITIKVDDGAAICLLPDPVQPFKDSVYEQVQVFKVAETASVCMLDWVTQGRTALGEDWSFVSWKGRNEIWQVGNGDGAKDRLMIRDTVKLSGQDPLLLGTPLSDTMHKHGVFGTIILRGDRLAALGEFFLGEFAVLPRLGARDFKTSGTSDSEEGVPSGLEAWRAQRMLMEREEKVLWCAASIRGCTIVKFGAASVEGGRRWIGSMLVKEGSVSKIFGDEALFCVR